MAVGWMLDKVMGKSNETSRSPGALETESSLDPENCRSCFRKSTWRWIVTVVLSLQLLIFVLLTVIIRKSDHGALVKSMEAPFMFMFKLQRSASIIQKYKAELEANLSSHIPFSHMRVSLYSVNQTDSRYAEVRFQLIPEPQVPYNDSAVKRSLVKFFLQERNISLAQTTFGQVYDFQINKFPGGISIVPGKSQKSRRSPQFNFTLPNSTISGVSTNIQVFKHELAAGVCLRHNESLIVRLTNLDGSTVESPVIVETSVFRTGGRHHLSPKRLKELAFRVQKHHRNLGLNHTMFGRIADLQFSDDLRHILGLDRVSSPSPAPGPALHLGAAQTYNTDQSYGHTPELLYPGASEVPTAAPVFSIQTGFATAPDFVATSPVSSRSDGGISSIPAAAPSSSGWNLERLSALRIVLVATAILALVL